jgi:hypothetical protein
MSEALYVLWPYKKGVWFCGISVTDCHGGHIQHTYARLTKYPEKFRGVKRCKNLRAKIIESIDRDHQ